MGSWSSAPIVGSGAKPSTYSGGSGKSGSLGKFLLLGKFGKMQKVTHINDLLASLSRIVPKKIWNVHDENGTLVQGVSASDNRKHTAQKYIDGKYPGRVMRLKFAGTKGYITLP